MFNWHLAYTKPKSEDNVSRIFAEAGFEVLNPKLKEQKYLRNKLQNVITPLFPCYIFIEFEYEKDYRTIKYTRGVRRVVGTDYMPSIVPANIIDSIRSSMEAGLITIKPQRFQPGEEVIIKAGPFQGFDAIFERELKGIERVSILLKSINAKAVVDAAILAKSV